MFPTSLTHLVDALNKLPSISQKMAQRLAYYLLKENNQSLDQFIEIIKIAKTQIKLCKFCAHLTEQEICYICQDKTRQNILIIVESPLDVFKFEKIDGPKNYYHVLGGLVDINSENVDINLNVISLKKRIKQFNEVILALSPTLSGIVTSNYIKQILGKIKLSELAQGIPLGAAIEYVDPLTLKAALNNRQGLK